LGGKDAAGFRTIGDETLMEADWSAELAATDPVITVPWAASGDDEAQCRFFDLRQYPNLVAEIEEAQGNLALRSALLLLNGSTSHLWTAKCDAWSSSPEHDDDPFDPYEMDAEPGETAFGAGSYIDLLPRDLGISQCFEGQEQWLRAVTERLRGIPASAARVELVLRRAVVDAVPGYGVTWFVEGCGASAERAEQAWGGAFDLALAAIMDVPLK
jgi:hypothetical protein